MLQPDGEAVILISRRSHIPAAGAMEQTGTDRTDGGPGTVIRAWLQSSKGRPVQNS